MYIEKGDLVSVRGLTESDKIRGIKAGIVYRVTEIDVDGDYIIKLNNGSGWILSYDQIELVTECKQSDYHALESAIRELDREIAQRALEMEMLKEARDKMLQVLKMKE